MNRTCHDMSKGSIIFTVGVALVLSSSLALAFRPSFYPPSREARTYVDMADGNFNNIYSYQGERIFHPMTVRFVAHVLHRPIDARVFIWLSAAALIGLFVLLAIQYGIDYSYAGGLWILVLVAATVVDSYRNYYWHDLFYAALCALFFLALRINPWLALPILFLIYLTRESTIVLVAAFVVIAVLRRQWKVCIAVAGVGLLAMKVDAALVARSLPNNEGVSLLVLDFLKIPYNFIQNICGVELWTNTIAATADPPIWTWHVPSWLQIGQIREVGYSGLFWEEPAQTLLLLLTAFGILPLVAIRAVARNWKQLLNERFDILLALVYGGLMFVLAPLEGVRPDRYVLYAWPAFWLFGVSAVNVASLTARKRFAVVLLSVLVAWIPAIIRRFSGPVTGPESISFVASWSLVGSLAVTIAAYVGAWRIFRTAPAESPSVNSSLP
jgi:hypothetical protein